MITSKSFMTIFEAVHYESNFVFNFYHKSASHIITQGTKGVAFHRCGHISGNGII